MNAAIVTNQLQQHGVVPVIRTKAMESAVRSVDILAEAGFSTFEITMSVPGAVDLIARLSERDGVLVGAGTVLTMEQADRCLAAGARYIVSPCLIDALPGLCLSAGAACIMSGLTPTEVIAVSRTGAHAVKIFPASSVGGPSHLKALKEVFPELLLVPTGGVNRQNIPDYVAAGAAFVGVGSDLVKPPSFESRPRDELVAHARSYLDIYRQEIKKRMEAGADPGKP